MKNNSDKQLREKLKDIEYPFDPQAWEQMEAMLNEKKKRRVFFWWRFSGMAAALLLFAMIGYEAGKKVGSGRLEVANAKSEIKNQKSEVNSLTNAPRLNDEVGQGIPMADEKISDDRNEIAVSSHQEKNGVSKLLTRAEKENPQRVISDENKKSGKRKINNEKNESKKVSQSNDENLLELPVASQPQQEEVVTLNTLYALLASNEDELNAEKKEETALPKKKKPIVRYSLGVMGTLTASTAGWKNYNPQYTMEEAGKPSFYKYPSYMVGITNDLLFADRFALTAGFLYAQTSFKVYAPYAQGYSETPLSYASHIQGLAIPMGIKVYPLVTKKLNLYASAGFIHHIKLKETFGYTVPPPVFTSMGDVTEIFPSTTDFENKNSHLSNSNLANNATNTNTFSINKAKRYYTTFYAGFGVEGVVRNRWIFFAEPTYYMTLQRIGYQERRKFDFGGSAGMRYKF